MDCAIGHDEIKDILISKRALWLAGENTIEHLRAEIDGNFSWLIMVGASSEHCLAWKIVRTALSCIKIKMQYLWGERTIVKWIIALGSKVSNTISDI